MKRIFLAIGMVALMLVSGTNVYMANQRNEMESNLSLENVEAEAGWWESFVNWYYDSTPLDTFYDENGQSVYTGLPGTNWYEYTVRMSCSSSFGYFSESYYKDLRYCGYGQGSCSISEHC